MRNLLLGIAVLGAAGCTTNTRPKTAMELCTRVLPKFDAKVTCQPVTDPAVMTALQAVEAAELVDGKTQVGWVSYAASAPKNDMAGLFTLMGRQFAGVALLEEHNDPARVGMYVVRGQISADGWDSLSQQIRKLEP
ncbi:MAG: hypothetical protein QM817_39080 [Archangium sp.]